MYLMARYCIISMDGYYTIEELKSKGITVYGENVRVSKFANIYKPSNLILHDNIRIDDFTVISCKGKVEIFNYVHIGSHCMISSSTNIILKSYSGISSGAKLYGGCDDFSGDFMTNPMVPGEYLNVQIGDIILEEHALIGSSSIILPNVILRPGTAIAAMSLVKKNTEPWMIYGGVPAKIIKPRNQQCLQMQIDLERKYNILKYSAIKNKGDENQDGLCEAKRQVEFLRVCKSNAGVYPSEEEKMRRSLVRGLENDNLAISLPKNIHTPTTQRTIFITGGSKGIGKSIALYFKELQYNVVISYNKSINDASDLQTKGIHIYKIDVTNNAECVETIRNIIVDFGRIDILVNNAGVIDNQLFHKMLPEQWTNVISTNVNSLYNVTHPIIQNMIENGYGRIINISSIYGLKGSKGQSNYSSSKHAVIGFTKTLALEYSDKNILVNCICPGLVNTDMIKSIHQKTVNKIIDSIPIKKIIEPFEIAKACEFLANSDYCTGTILNLDCGMNC